MRQPIKSKTEPLSFQFYLWVCLSVFSSLVFKPSPVYGAEAYYYLHISSFRMEVYALQDVDRLKNKGYDAIATREQVPNKGYWYRVYVGPFAAQMEAYLKANELKSKKIVDYAAIQKKPSPLGSELAQAPSTVTTPSPVSKTPPKESPTKQEEITHPEKPVKGPSTQPSPSKSSEKVPPSKTSKKPSQKVFGVSQGGYGRNIGSGKVALGFRHTYLEVDPDLTKRTLTTSDGTTTTTQNVSIVGNENERSTSMHLDSLFVRWGLTGWLEIFGYGGIAYNDFSNINPAYGGGLRLNLFDVKEGGLKGFYGALQGEYATGTVGYDYDSTAGSKWRRETDWKEIFAKGELGLVRSSFKGYVGGSYLYYQEETERQLLANIPAPFISYAFNDELEEKSFGAYGGVVINLSPSFLLNIEGQVLNKKGIFGAIEYHF